MLTSEVIQEIAVQHPITYDIYHTCELSASMHEIIKVCHLYVEVNDVTDICVKRKQQYTDRLNGSCDGCVCRK